MYWRSPKRKPVGVAIRKRAVRAMDIILHIGAHRTGTTSLQNYLRQSGEALSEHGFAFFGPARARKEIAPLACSPRHDLSERKNGASELAVLNAALSAKAQRVIVSDENIMGSTGTNIRKATLYPDVGRRVSEIARVFDSSVSTILISTRSLETYWCSALAYNVKRRGIVPDLNTRARIARSFRGWRDVISDVAAGLPGVTIKVLPFEVYAGRPDRFLADALGVHGPVCRERGPVNASPGLPDLRRAVSAKGGDAGALPLGMGRWNPFNNEQHSALRELYADDMMWLTAGADGLATLLEDGSAAKAGPNPPRFAKGKGQIDECEKRRMARPG